MKKRRFLALALTLALTLSLASPALALSSQSLVKKQRGYPGFADVQGSWCEPYVKTAYEAGVMSGTSAAAFSPNGALTYAQVAALAARLHSLLNGGDGKFDSGTPWYRPYLLYLQQQEASGGIDYLPYYMRSSYFDYEYAHDNCSREDFVYILYCVLPESALEPINEVEGIPDADDYYTLAFYDAGVLTGQDQYGAFRGGDSVTRAEAAVILARIVDPALRRVFTLTPFDLGKAVLGVDGSATFLTVDGYEITAELFAYVLLQSTESYLYEHNSDYYTQYADYWEEYLYEDFYSGSFADFLLDRYGIDVKGGAVQWNAAGKDGMTPAAKVKTDTLQMVKELAVLYNHAKSENYTPTFSQKQTISYSSYAENGKSADLNKALAVFGALNTNLAAAKIPSEAEAATVLRQNEMVCGLLAVFDREYDPLGLSKNHAQAMRNAAAAHPGDTEYFEYLSDRYSYYGSSVSLYSKYDFTNANWSALSSLGSGQVSAVLEEDAGYLVFMKVDPSKDRTVMKALGAALARSQLSQWAEASKTTASSACASLDYAACCQRVQQLSFAID